MCNPCGVVLMVPAVMLLTVSFFVLVVLGKVASGALKGFGYAVVLLLWVVSVAVFSAGITIAAGGPMACPLMQKMKCGEISHCAKKKGVCKEYRLDTQKMQAMPQAKQGAVENL
jgi:hypothetical protein